MHSFIKLSAFTHLYAFTHCKHSNDIHYKSLGLRILIINNSTTTTTTTYSSIPSRPDISWRNMKMTIAFFQDFTLDMYFRQFWTDPRLSFQRRPGLEKLVVGADYIKLIWVPDTFFVNEKTAYFHKATTENQFLRILHTGEILRSIRYKFLGQFEALPKI